MPFTQILHPSQIGLAVDALRAGDLVVFPTDTVYGVAALAQNEHAVIRLFAAKGRDFKVALPVMVADIALVGGVARPLPGFLELAQAFWPGPLTIVLPRLPSIPDLVTGGDTVGLRIPDHPLALELLRLVDAPLAVTSANRSGEPPARTAEEARAQLEGRVEVIVDGGTAPGGQASTVLDLTQSPPKIVRPGPITADQILAIIGEVT
ncbi:MAG: threonylcarbamoyl-AMP synthase [Caldilineales bacterium]|nr:threonylcarbamoyl-AMP synthase [Caldilineales bacterium]